jgi:hypothetical protein
MKTNTSTDCIAMAMQLTVSSMHEKPGIVPFQKLLASDRGLLIFMPLPTRETQPAIVQDSVGISGSCFAIRFYLLKKAGTA